MINIRKTTPQDHDAILKVELAAFDQDPEIKTLVTDLFNDPTAEPIVSLLAYDGDKPVGRRIPQAVPSEGPLRCSSSGYVSLCFSEGWEISMSVTLQITINDKW